MRNRKKASCCEWSAPVNSYRCLLKSWKKIVSDSYSCFRICTAIIFVKLFYLPISYLDLRGCYVNQVLSASFSNMVRVSQSLCMGERWSLAVTIAGLRITDFSVIDSVCESEIFRFPVMFESWQISAELEMCYSDNYVFLRSGLWMHAAPPYGHDLESYFLINVYLTSWLRVGNTESKASISILFPSSLTVQTAGNRTPLRRLQ